MFAPVISHKLSLMFNNCINNGIYPNVLKTAKVIPIFKTGNRSDPGNYRPISILSDVNKIYEELILSRVNGYLKSKNILSNTQYGFRTNVLI